MPSPGDVRRRLMRIYRAMLRRLGPQGWWPGRTPFEVIVGAILTQNTAWTNVEKAIRNLQGADLLSPQKLSAVPRATLARLIRPSGYYNIKAQRLQNFLSYLRRRHGLSLRRLFSQPPGVLRQELLGVPGIGPETADSILLYAGDLPLFVVDAYTRRIFSRHCLLRPPASYDQVQAFFMRHLPHNPSLYNEYHALLVSVGKTFCRKVPRCEACPLRFDLPPGGPRL